MPDSYLAAVVEDCLRALKAGVSRDECLRAYPELRSQLAPMLQSAIVLQAEPVVLFPTAGKMRQRARLLASIQAEPRRK